MLFLKYKTLLVLLTFAHKLFRPVEVSGVFVSDYGLKSHETSKDLEKRRAIYDAVKLTTPEEYPYAVMLFLNNKSEYLGFCSGSLVSLDWVLTTVSNCFMFKVTNVDVYAGGNSEKEWLSKEYRKGYQLRSTTEIYVHPNMYEGSFVSYFDVALVKVEPFVKTSTVSVVNVSTAPWKFEEITKCTLTGFGKDPSNKTNEVSSIRKTYHIKVGIPCPCLNTSSKTKNNYNWLCYTPKKDLGICKSDWGAALVCDGVIKGVSVNMTTYKDINTCTRDDCTECSSCANEKSLSIFQNTFPCISWMNSHLDWLQHLPRYGSNAINIYHTFYQCYCIQTLFVVFVSIYFYFT